MNNTSIKLKLTAASLKILCEALIDPISIKVLDISDSDYQNELIFLSTSEQEYTLEEFKKLMLRQLIDKKINSLYRD